MAVEKCNNKNPLRLKGTAQESRLPVMLDPSQVLIDGKTSEDYLRVLQELAKLIQYYTAKNLRDGDWEAFFTDLVFDKGNPHTALFEAFVELISYVQDDINDITAKHLDFYYQEVLQIALKSETPDEAHILFTLANNINEHLIEEGTLLKAGKDDDGNDRLFKVEEEIVVNRGTVSELKSVFLEKDTGTGTTWVYAAPIANSSDGEGGELNEENPKWTPFGESQRDLKTPSMSLAELGFAIASDFLLLKEGKRKITLTIQFASSHGISVGNLDKTEFECAFSGEEEWISIEPDSVEITEADVIKLQVTLPEDEKGVLAYNEEALMEQFDVNVPVMKLMLKQTAAKSAYAGLVKSAVNSVQIDVDVEGVKDFVLQNETGTLDSSKPFDLFASRPVVGSQFLIGSQEVFSKPLTSLGLVFDWQDKPDNFSTYYSQYETGVNESDFGIQIDALKKRKWDNNLHATSDTVELFQDEISLEEITTAFSALEKVSIEDEFTNDTTNGFIRLELKEPASGLIAFGHSQYQNIYVSESIKMARSSTYTANFPSEPYTPKVKSFAVNYKASHTLTLNAGKAEGDISGSFFHIGPFGIAEQESSGTESITLLPDFENEGEFYIGISDLELPQNLNLLFQVAEGSANPQKLPEEITWSYLADNTWVDFKTESVLSDSSNGLINSGIISFDLPTEMTSNNTLFTNEMHWIRAVIAENSDSVCQMIGVHAQAITAVFENNENNLAHLVEALPAETIARLDDSDSSIKEVAQPYASFNGRLPEEEENYYRRVAERLRHKNRAITIWDYERIVLEEFPAIYKIKCLNHTRIEEKIYSEQAPGHVSLIVISNLRNQNAVNLLKPTTSLATLQAIDRFIEEVKNPFTEVHVKNPDFEEVQVEFNVKLIEGKDKGFYQTQLNKDIKKHLSPWAYQEGVDITFEGVIHKSEIINFIEELDYVDYVTCFKMYHFDIDDDRTKKPVDINEAEPSRSSALLVSAEEHKITIMTDDDCTCAGDNIKNKTITDGIGAMTVALDLIVNKP